jgi:hypothetical protein
MRMKAIAVTPGKAGSIHLRDVPKPSVGDVPDGRAPRQIEPVNVSQAAGSPAS